MSSISLIKKIYAAFFEQAFPLDLALIIVWNVASIGLIFLPIQNALLLKIVLTIPLVLFIPGYCLIAALFPKDGDIHLFERIALSFGLSFVIVPLIGLGLNFTQWGIRLDSIVISLTIFIWILVLIAHYRRVTLPSDERFRIPFSEIVDTFSKATIPNGGSRIDRILSYLLIVVILIAMITMVYVIAYPKEGEHFTEFYILGEKQMASDYPGRILFGLNYPMQIGVVNHEYRNVTYMIEIWGLRTEFDTMNNTSTIMMMDPIEQMPLTLTHNDTMIIPYNLSLTKTSYNRVEFLLFNESVPAPEVSGNDRINASYRDLYLWVDVR